MARWQEQICPALTRRQERKDIGDEARITPTVMGYPIQAMLATIWTKLCGYCSGATAKTGPLWSCVKARGP
jgi:hypothetical protein